MKNTKQFPPALREAIDKYGKDHPIREVIERAVGRVATYTCGTNGGEWHSPCPLCGGKDRLGIHPTPPTGTPRAVCRNCKRAGDSLRWAMWIARVDPTATGETGRFLRKHGYLTTSPSYPPASSGLVLDEDRDFSLDLVGRPSPATLPADPQGRLLRLLISEKGSPQNDENDENDGIGDWAQNSAFPEVGKNDENDENDDDAGGDPASGALRAAGFPARTIFVEFEFSPAASKKTGLLDQIHDPNFRVRGVALLLDDEVEFLRTPRSKFDWLMATEGEGWPSLTVLLIDGHRDGYVLDRLFGVRPKNVVCIASLSNAVLGRRGKHGRRSWDLDEVAEHYRLATTDARGRLEVCRRLLADLPRPDVELRAIDHTIRLFTRRRFDLDLEAARRQLARADAPSPAQLKELVRQAELVGGVPVHLIYCGAHTGRFTGVGVNLHGLDARLRPLLHVRGRALLRVDLAQIEARIVAWLAGDVSLLAAFAEGRDVYSEFASLQFQEPVRKPRAEELPDEEVERVNALRAVGKEAILGLCFGLGAAQFEKNLESNPTTAALFTSGMLSCERVAKIVESYRSAHPTIVGLWDELARNFNEVVEGAPRAGRFRRRDADVLMDLPSGRFLVYRRPVRRDELEHEDAAIRAVVRTDGGEGEAIHGSKLLENLAQATARDLLVEDVLSLEARGWPVMLHVHDEVVLAVHDADAVRALADAVEIMTTPPAWARGLPLAADGEIQPPRDQTKEADATWLPPRTPEVEEAFTKDEDGTIYI